MHAPIIVLLLREGPDRLQTLLRHKRPPDPVPDGAAGLLVGDWRRFQIAVIIPISLHTAFRKKECPHCAPEKVRTWRGDDSSAGLLWPLRCNVGRLECTVRDCVRRTRGVPRSDHAFLEDDRFAHPFPIAVGIPANLLWRRPFCRLKRRYFCVGFIL
jgi:hypothetical protein